MRQQHAPLAGGPLQDLGVTRLHEAYILHADQVEFGVSAKQAADNVAVEVLVTDQAEHGLLLSGPGAPSGVPAARPGRAAWPRSCGGSPPLPPPGAAGSPRSLLCVGDTRSAPRRRRR